VVGTWCHELYTAQGKQDNEIAGINDFLQKVVENIKTAAPVIAEATQTGRELTLWKPEMEASVAGVLERGEQLEEKMRVYGEAVTLTRLA